MSFDANVREREADEQASLWAARMDNGAMSLREREELTRWLDADPRHRTLLKRYCEFSTAIEPLLAASVHRGVVRLPEREPKRSFWRGVAPWLAGGLAAAAVALAVFPPSQPTVTWEARKVATPVAQRQNVTLKDGSVVELSALTSLEVQEGSTERRLRLAAGQAYFSVAKDASRPFIVETPAGSVRVTGTVFDVRSIPGQGFEVTVQEGSVQVSPMAWNDTSKVLAPVMLSASDRLVVSPTGVSITHLSAEDLSDVLAWRQGKVVFENTPLREALRRFASYHGRGLSASEDAGELQLGGRYNLDDLDGFFTAIESLLPVEVSRATNGTIRVVRRTDPPAI